MKIVFLLYPNMLATSVSLPMELLHAADALLKTSSRSKVPVKLGAMDIELVSLDGDPITTHTGLSLAASRPLRDIKPDEPEIVYLPALWRNPIPVVEKNTEITAWLKQAYEHGVTIAGVGTGCCFMAEAGMLANKPATTHWYFFDQFQKRYPDVHLKRQHFITQAGQLYCTGSVNSLADLTVVFIGQYFSRDIAQHVERHFFHEIRRAFHIESSLLKRNNAHPDEDIIQTQIWLRDNYAKEIKLTEVAKQFGMSNRTFNRRFKLATGETPLEYLQKTRIEIAKDLLQTTNLGVSDIMSKIGYHDAAYFTRLFKRTLGTTPTQYRTTVRAKLFTPVL